MNETLIPVKDFQDYTELYLDEDGEKVYEKCSLRWEVAMAISTSGQFQQVSFVNSIATLKGGTHVAHVADQLVEAITKRINKDKDRGKGSFEIKPAHVKNHLLLFVNCLIENPSFSSQTKEWMNLKQEKFGSSCRLSKKFIDSVLDSGVCDRILAWTKAKEKLDLAREVKTKGTVSVVVPCHTV